MTKPCQLQLSVKERATAYNLHYGEKYPASALTHYLGKVFGLWYLGNNYQGRGYYGSYPPEYLNRVMALFPDAEMILHLFSGSLPPDVKGVQLDINPHCEPDIVADAHTMGSLLGSEVFDLICADPPYSQEDAVHYGTVMVNRRKVLQECHTVLRRHGWVVWLDQVWPMFSKHQWIFRGGVGVVRSTNHRVRLVTLLEKR